MDEQYLDRLLRRTLGGSYLTLEVVHYVMTEYVRPEARCRVVVTLRRDGHQEAVEGQGVGFVEAAYRGLVDHYGRDFACLNRVGFVGFGVDGRMETSRDLKGLDAFAEVKVGVRSPGGERLDFAAQARSTLAAALGALVRVVERFANAEQAVRTLRAEADTALRRGEVDVLATRRSELATLWPLTGALA